MKIICWICILCTALPAFSQAPVANFSVNVTSGCAPLTVRFTNQSTGNPTEFFWSFGNGVISEQQNPVITFSQPGEYDVTLVVRNRNGTTEIIREKLISVSVSPNALFNTNSNIACLPAAIQFNDMSTSNGGDIVRWQWEFSDGQTSSERNPLINFSQAGYYDARLTVYSANNCSHTRNVSNYIRILNGVTTNFKYSDPQSCVAPLQVQFTDETAAPGNLTYLWDFGNGNTSTQKNPVFSFSQAGDQDVSLTVSSEYGCSNSITKTIPLKTTSTDFSAPETVCVNQPVTFTNLPGGELVSSQWDFGNGSRSTARDGRVTYSDPGTYTITLENAYENCLGTATKTIIVTGPPAVEFSTDQTLGCEAPFTVQFTAQTDNGVQFLWNFGDGNTSTEANPTHTYTSSGNYSVTLTVTNENGCSNTITKTDEIKIQAPALAITDLLQGGCSPLTINPSIDATAIDGIASVIWNFGEQGSSSNQSPTFTFNNVGEYTVSATITTNNGCQITESSQVLAGTPPTADFVNPYDSVCSSTALDFKALATGEPGTYTYLWEINNTTYTTEEIRHRISDTGEINIKLTTFHNFCATDQPAIKKIYVKAPVSRFRHTVDCTDRSVRFNNISLANDNDPSTTYFWEFGADANIATSNAKDPPVVRFNGPGSYLVRLTVSTSDCRHISEQRVTIVDEKAAINMLGPHICVGSTTRFQAGGNPDHIKTYEWAFNNNTFSEGDRTVQHIYSSTDNNAVQLRITDINNCTSTARLDDIQSFEAISRFTPSVQSGCEGLQVQFTNESVPGGSSQLISYQWDFGDNNTSTEANPLHTFTTSGDYNVKLNITDGMGCQASYQLPVPIQVSGLQAAFTMESDIVCPNVDVAFTTQSRGSQLSYLWNFGDEQTSQQANPVHTFDGAQSSYEIQLTVSDQLGCTTSAKRTLRVEQPTVDLIATNISTICPPLETNFEHQASNYRNLIWNFGDGQSSTLENPTHFFNNYGVYQATLTAEGYGCTVSATREVRVLNPREHTRLNYNPIDGCGDMVVNFEGEVPPDTRWSWDTNDGNQYPNTLAFEHRYRNPGRYVPRIILTDSTQCVVPISGSDRINVLGSRVIFDMDKRALCDNGNITFRDFSLVSTNDVLDRHVWDFGDGSDLYTGKSAAHQYAAPGTYVVKKYVYTQHCENVETDTIRVFRTPEPVISSDDFVCIGDAVPFTASLAVADTAIQWSWRMNGSTVSTAEQYQTVFGSTGIKSIQLTAISGNSCTGTGEKSIEVLPPPTISFSSNPLTLVLGSEMSIPVTYSNEQLNYKWTPDIAISCTDCAHPVINPKKDITYYVTATNEHGCTNTEELAVKVVCNDQNFFIPNTFSPNGDGKNDVFFPRGKALSQVKSMRIFNRWGQMVYQRNNFNVNDASAGWNGMMNGKSAPPDVYIYTIEFLCENGFTVPYTGNITLLR